MSHGKNLEGNTGAGVKKGVVFEGCELLCHSLLISITIFDYSSVSQASSLLVFQPGVKDMLTFPLGNKTVCT